MYPFVRAKEKPVITNARIAINSRTICMGNCVVSGLAGVEDEFDVLGDGEVVADDFDLGIEEAFGDNEVEGIASEETKIE